MGEDWKEAQIGSRPVDDRVAARAWPDATDAADAPAEDDEAESTTETDDEPPARSITVRPPTSLARPGAPATRVAARFQARPRPVVSERPIPAAPVPCPTCASTSTTVALLQSRVAELSALLGTAQTAVRDARRDAENAQQAARSRGRRAQQAEAEVARLRSDNAELIQALRELRAENRALHQQAAEIVGLVDSFDR